MKWQLIETAPKDGSAIIVYDPDDGDIAVVEFYQESWTSKYCVDSWIKFNNATHWMPLPQPPKEK